MKGSGLSNQCPAIKWVFQGAAAGRKFDPGERHSAVSCIYRRLRPAHATPTPLAGPALTGLILFQQKAPHWRDTPLERCPGCCRDEVQDGVESLKPGQYSMDKFCMEVGSRGGSGLQGAGALWTVIHTGHREHALLGQGVLLDSTAGMFGIIYAASLTGRCLTRCHTLPFTTRYCSPPPSRLSRLAPTALSPAGCSPATPTAWTRQAAGAGVPGCGAHGLIAHREWCFVLGAAAWLGPAGCETSNACGSNSHRWGGLPACAALGGAGQHARCCLL